MKVDKEMRSIQRKIGQTEASRTFFSIIKTRRRIRRTGDRIADLIRCM